MFSFLRRIRYKILKENNFFRYLKYAIGEIILVVIGILIAVAINSKYNNAQNDEKIKNILFQIQRELLTDIQDSKRIYNEYILKDSIYRMIMNDTSLVYLHQQSPYSFRINSSYVSFSNKKAGYNRLLNNIEVIPENYNYLVSELNYLHVELQDDIDDYNDMIKDAVLTYYDNENEANPTFSKMLWNGNSDETLNYYTNDPFFKNKMSWYINALRNIEQVANDYRIESISIYKAIDSLTGHSIEKNNTLLNTIPQEADYNEFLGQYSDGKNSVSLSVKGENLILGDLMLYWHEGNYYYSKASYNIIKLYRHSNDYFIRITNTNNEQVFKKINTI